MTWVNLGNIMLSRGKEVTKDYIIFHLCEMSRIGKFIETENRLLLA
jgi:hypothetical protein